MTPNGQCTVNGLPQDMSIQKQQHCGQGKRKTCGRDVTSKEKILHIIYYISDFTFTVFVLISPLAPISLHVQVKWSWTLRTG